MQKLATLCIGKQLNLEYIQMEPILTTIVQFRVVISKLQLELVFVFFNKFLLDTCPFVGPLIPSFLDFW